VSVTAVPRRERDRASARSASAPIVDVRSLRKRFPLRRSWRETLLAPRAGQWVTSVQDVSFTIAPGEFFGLLGPNGAGKTTLLKMLATLILPDSGEAIVAGHDVVHEAGAVRRVLTPVIASERSLYWRLSARENLELFAALLGVPRAEERSRIEEVLAVVGLAETGGKMVGQFSSGMMQRLLIARALLARPQVLLLDEPTRSLDPVSARDFRRFLREELAERRGCAVLLATHSAEEAFGLCDRVGILSRGELVASGAAEDLRREAMGGAAVPHHLWTRTPSHPALSALAARGGVRVVSTDEPDADGWARLVLAIDGGDEGAARVLRELVDAGIPVSRFELAPLALAELIERVIAARAPASGGRA
jgi:ABC-2 type transport system ATP-binding protein